jgi:hypothetical protein
MLQVGTLARLGGKGFLAVLAAIIAYKLISGFIPLRGLLTGERRNDTVYISFGRLQLLIVTIIVAGGFLWRFLAASSHHSLPEVSGFSLVVLTVSQTFYLWEKARGLRSHSAT